MLRTTHNAGFFSCCNVKLTDLAGYIHKNKKQPDTVDSSVQFDWYKNNTKRDITFDYFEDYNKIDVSFNTDFNYHWKEQFSDYKTLDYKNLQPLMSKYFSPSKDIEERKRKIENKYNLDYENTCVLFYRGNDKNTETKICGYNEYIIYAEQVLKKNPDTKFLIQSDETGFITFFQNKYPNSFYFKDEIRHMNKCNSTVDIVMKNQNFEMSKNYLCITIIMSRCKYVICGSGNCSLFIVLYRGNSDNVYQNLNNKWIS
jgi:hypothetical protein